MIGGLYTPIWPCRSGDLFQRVGKNEPGLCWCFRHVFPRSWLDKVLGRTRYGAPFFEDKGHFQIHTVERASDPTGIDRAARRVFLWYYIVIGLVLLWIVLAVLNGAAKSGC